VNVTEALANLALQLAEEGSRRRDAEQRLAAALARIAELEPRTETP
jgi:hypothetical protein